MGEKYYSQIKEVNLPSNKYVLVLPGWYPTWQDPFTGDFNQRQVKAAGIQTPQVVLYIGKDQTKKLTTVETRYKQLTENIIEISVIYPEKSNKRIDTIYSNLIYLRLLHVYSNIIKKTWGKPLLIHSYIVIRGGLGGLLLSRKWKIPFILSEHWTIYYPQDPGYLLKRNLVFRWIVKLIFENIRKYLPVTNSLKQQVYTLLKAVPTVVVPNVVDTKLFFYRENTVKKNLFRFVHVSTMTYQKNPEGLLRGFKKFKELHTDNCLWMVGPYPSRVLDYARSIGLTENEVHFTGSVSYNEVAEILHNSQALVLFSRYENLPCVILEALCCGLPVISTDVGGVSEVVNAHNGILLKSKDEEQLCAAFTKIFTSFEKYDQRSISYSATHLFSYDAVGSLLTALYRDINNS